MKCKHCNGDGFIIEVNHGYADKYMCDYCWGTGVVEPLTEQEHLQTCDTEQLAEWLSSTFDLCGAGCSNCFVKEICFGDNNAILPTEMIVEWLKQPHTIKE